MADIIELRGPGNNGNELITVERDKDGTVTVYRDGVLSEASSVAAVLADARVSVPDAVDDVVAQAERFKVRGEALDAFVKGAPIEDFETGKVDLVDEIPIEGLPVEAVPDGG